MPQNDVQVPTHEEAIAILEKYGFWVDPKFLRRRPEIEREVLRFCDAHLNEEYHALALKLLQFIEDEAPEAFGRGDIKIWAAGFWHALGSVNFLFDPASTPHVKSSQIAEFYSVKLGSMTQRSTSLREAVGLDQLDTRFLIPQNKARIEELHGLMAQSLSTLAPGTTPEEVLAEMPNWGRRRSSRAEFVDRDRAAMTEFYDLLESADTESDDPKDAARFAQGLQKLIARDPDFLDPYLSLGEMHDNMGRHEKAAKLLDEAYNRALRLICDKNGIWPKRLDWGWLENRHILRTLFQRAFSWWQDKQPEPALELLRKIFKACPDDNLGARYFILALRQNMTFAAFERKFNSHQVMQKWFDRDAPKFPEDFAAYFEHLKTFE
ncbi:MAG: hypothetical protein KY445_06410 [Armatimonadetes bacterium]|nr:hypothetical protein [Armatimonadota bacterium]